MAVQAKCRRGERKRRMAMCRAAMAAAEMLLLDETAEKHRQIFA